MVSEMAGFVEVLILVVLLYWLFFPRAHSMLDVLSAGYQEIKAICQLHIEPFRGPVEPRGSPARVEPPLLKRRSVPNHIIRRNSSGVKKAVGTNQKSLSALCCKTCAPNAEEVGTEKESRSVRNILLVDTAGVENGFFTRQFCHLAYVSRIKRHEYPQLSHTVLRDERLREAIDDAARQDLAELKGGTADTYEKLVMEHEARARRIVANMRSTLSDFLLRLTSWVLLKLLPCFLTSVVAHPAQVTMLKAAGQTGLPLVFLPLHRSHLDYILISFILLNNDIRSPLVAAGDNLKIPVFGWLLRGLGAFFIKRRMDPVLGRKDTVYRAVLHTYMMECLRAGHNLEFFIEGGRTRTGKACMPKGGLISVIVDAYLDGTIEDALLVPVSMNYEKLVDGNYVREQLGQPKQMESFGSAIRGIWGVLNSNYGIVEIDFKEPVALSELVRSFQGGSRSRMPSCDAAVMQPVKHRMHSVPSSASLYGTDLVAEDQRYLVENIARHIIYGVLLNPCCPGVAGGWQRCDGGGCGVADCTHLTAVMSTNAVAFLLLNKFRLGASLEQLVEALDEMRLEVLAAGRELGFVGESVDVVNHACELLGPGLVRRERRQQGQDGEPPEVTVTPVTMLPNVIELSYYSNSLLSFYVIDAVVAMALYALASPSSLHGLVVLKERLMDTALELCDALQFEFIFTKPCQVLEKELSGAMARLERKGVLRRLQPDKVFGNESSSEEEESGDFLGPSYKVDIAGSPAAAGHLDFLHGLLRPLVDTYTASALGLSCLVGRQLPERDLVQDLLTELKTQLDRGLAYYGESLCVDPIRNALKLFERWGVLECHMQDRIKLYYLSDQFDSEFKTRTVYERLSRFRWTRV